MNLASLDQTAPRRGRRGRQTGSPPPPPPVPLASFPSPRAELLSAGDPPPGKAACVSSCPGVKPATQAGRLTLITPCALQRPVQCALQPGDAKEPVSRDAEWQGGGALWPGQPRHRSQSGNGTASPGSALKTGLFGKHTHCSARSHHRDKATRGSLPPLTPPVP